MNLYLMQTSVTFGEEPYYYLPYSVGSLWAYASSFKNIKDNYKLKDIFFIREPIDTILSKIDNPSVFAFSVYIWNENYSLELARKIKERFSNCVIIIGGPSVPQNS